MKNQSSEGYAPDPRNASQSRKARRTPGSMSSDPSRVETAAGIVLQNDSETPEVSSKRRPARPRTRPPEFDPLRTAPPKAQRRYARLGEKAHQSPLSAVKLHCLSCVGWSYPEARSCQIATCGLYGMNQHIFRGSTENGAHKQESVR